MKKAIILFMLCIFCSPIFAANKITGTITDGNTNEKLEFVTVELLASDSSFIKGTATNTNGYFIITGIEKGNYILRAAYIGYEKTNISILNIDTNINLGNISLFSKGLQLNEVTVTAAPVIKQTDRQIILPTQSQIKASSNGLTLLKNLQLSRVIVNPVDNTIKLPGGDNVQLRINDVKVTQSEIIALSPSDIIRIEYIDDPGMRYNAGAVLNYITKRKESGGNIAGSFSNGISKTGYGENNISAKYNYKKSEFSTNLYWGRRNLFWIRENYETFKFPEYTLYRTEIGEPTKFKYDDLNFAVNYNLQYDDNHFFNITFRNNYDNTPNSLSDRISSLYQESQKLNISDKLSSDTKIPSLDIYYQASLKNKQQLTLNIVGTYLGSKSERLYTENISETETSTIYSLINGEKYSLIAEGLYEKELRKGKISGGLKYNLANIRNTYSGDIKNTVQMVTSESFAFAEYQVGIKKFYYTIGAGAMQTYNRQDNKSNTSYIFRPTLRISYKPNDNLFFRYNGYISAYSPSLSDLNDISQEIDRFQVRKGNPGLKPVTFYANTLTASWQKNKIAVEFFGRYSYDKKPIMESTLYNDGKFIRTMENQKNFHRINLQLSIQVLPFKEYISVMITPYLNRFISHGNNYTHTHTNAGVRGSIMAVYKNWSLTAEMNTSSHTLWGETITRDEATHTITVGYNKEKWNVSATVLNPFSKKYEIETENLSNIAPYKQVAFSKNLSPLFIVNISFNLDFGRSFKAKEKKIRNSDTDSGILSGKK